MQKSPFYQQIFKISNENTFNQLAIELFNYQAKENPIYNAFVKALKVDISQVNALDKIPFLPIQFFKLHAVKTSDFEPQMVFSSSGTSGMIRSRHFVKDLNLYELSFEKGFEYFYGAARDYTFLALLPSYMEREGSSLIYMVDNLIKQSSDRQSGYFLDNHAELYSSLLKLKAERKKVILIGVTYALLDFIEQYKINFPGLIVMETGGMKGKRPEMIREELHIRLKQGFGVDSIHSEYGMSELLSQAYSKGKGLFESPPWMRVFIRDTNDPFSHVQKGRSGGINIIDLANRDSCAFISTQDLGKLHPDNSFEILGRFDSSDIRGCNLLVQ